MTRFGLHAWLFSHSVILFVPSPPAPVHGDDVCATLRFLRRCAWPSPGRVQHVGRVLRAGEWLLGRTVQEDEVQSGGSALRRERRR